MEGVTTDRVVSVWWVLIVMSRCEVSAPICWVGPPCAYDGEVARLQRLLEERQRPLGPSGAWRMLLAFFGWIFFKKISHRLHILWGLAESTFFVHVDEMLSSEIRSRPCFNYASPG